jgi:hypothetical protein
LDAKCRYLNFSGLENQIPFAFLVSLIMAARPATEAAKMTIKGTVNSGISFSSEYNALALMTLLLFLQDEQHPQASRKQAEPPQQCSNSECSGRGRYREHHAAAALLTARNRFVLFCCHASCGF